MLARFDAQIAAWDNGQTSLSALVTNLEVLRDEIPHDRFQRGTWPLLSDVECVNASALSEGRRKLSDDEAAKLRTAFANLRKLLDAARREIDDPCRDGQSCRS